MAALGYIALVLSALSMCTMIIDTIAGNADSTRHSEYQAIGWAAVAALFFIAGRS